MTVLAMLIGSFFSGPTVILDLLLAGDGEDFLPLCLEVYRDHFTQYL
jgi:hypothetical protein